MNFNLFATSKKYDFNFCFLAAELKMDVLRERDEKDNLERKLRDEQKIRGKYQVPHQKQFSSRCR